MASSARPDKAPPVGKVSDVIANFQPTRRFAPPANQKPYSITSLDFDDTGELCLVARDDETLQIYNCKEGKHAKELKSQKYGVDLARFAHHPQSIIYASTKGDDAIRYLSSHDNSYIRYFRGHTAPVCCISLSPSSDTFVSTSLDDTLRLWDLRSQSPQAQLNLTSPYLATYDPTATVLAIACPPAQSVLLYDIRNYDKAPFATFDLRDTETAFAKRTVHHGMAAANTPGAMPVQHTPGDWTKLEFSNDGKHLLIGTTGPGHYLLDAFEGQLYSYLMRPLGSTGRLGPANLGALRSAQQSGSTAPGVAGQGDVCFSPDGRYVIGGSGESALYVWDAEDPAFEDLSAPRGLEEKAMRPAVEFGSGRGMGTSTGGPACVVGYNPRHNMLVTADRALVFWLPDME